MDGGLTFLAFLLAELELVQPFVCRSFAILIFRESVKDGYRVG